MNMHTPIPSGRLIASGGPVSAAIAAMRRANDLPPLLVEQFDREAVEIHTLRDTIKRQLQADFDRIDRCLVILDTLGGDPDLEPTMGYIAPGHVDEAEGDDLGRDPDLEPSLCGLDVGHPCQGGDDREAGDDNGLADDHGMYEQIGRFLAAGGTMNRLPSGWRA